MNLESGPLTLGPEAPLGHPLPFQSGKARPSGQSGLKSMLAGSQLTSLLLVTQPA